MADQLSGRELDAEIARFLGWANVEAGCYTPIGQELCGDDPEGVGGFNRTGRKIVPRYSERIADAMQVVEALVDKGFHWEFSSGNPHKVRHSAGRPFAQFWNYSKGEIDRDVGAEGATLPEAICRAALAAIGDK